MNERIKQLLLKVVPMAGEDGEYLPSLHTPEDIERYTELIVKECSEVLLRWKGEPFPFDEDLAARLIKEHFGVEE